MLSSKLRPVTRLISVTSSVESALNGFAKGKVISPRIGSSTSSSFRFITTEEETHFKERGFLDDEGLTTFNTLHELQVRSSLVFKENKLFGTYNEKSQSYDYMTYDEYNQTVNKCRTLLNDLGE